MNVRKGLLDVVMSVITLTEDSYVNLTILGPDFPMISELAYVSNGLCIQQQLPS